MQEISLKDLLEAGCHFGHQVTRSNPKAREFVYASRDKIQIIDLAKTKEWLEKAADFAKTMAASGGQIIFVGTKKQARTVIYEEAKRSGSFYIAKRWVGGLLTNWEEVKKNLKRMEDLRANLKSDTWTKKEKVLFEKKLKKLELIYGGIEGLTVRPQALYIIDTHKEDGAVREANRMGVPVIGIVDTNADPEVVSYPIPANDDAVKSISLITSYIADAVEEGRKIAEKTVNEESEEAVLPQEPETKTKKELGKAAPKIKAKKETTKKKTASKSAPKKKSKKKK